MQFTYPWSLLLIAPLWLIAGLWQWRHQRLRQRFRQAFSGPQHHRPGARMRDRAQFICLTTALTLAVIALARPRWGLGAPVTLRSPYDVLIAVDVSRSMLAEDVSPNRLERAKLLLYDVIQDAGDDRIGLLAFRNGSRIVSPLTRDSRFLQLALDGLSVHSAPPGPTDLGRAILDTLDAFSDDPDRRRVVLFVSDGEHLRGEVDAALDSAATRQIQFLTIGIGSRQGAPIPIDGSNGDLLTYRGERVITRRVDNVLSRLAEKTSGRYLLLGDASADVAAFYRASRPRDPSHTAVRDSIRNQPTERFQWFLAPAIVLLVIVAGISRGRPVQRNGSTTRSPTDRGAYAGLGLLLGCLIWPSAIPAAPLGGRMRAALHRRQADSLIRQGAYLNAGRMLDQSLETLPAAPQADRLHQAGHAWYRAGHYTTAVERLEHALDHRPDPIIHYNLALARQRAAIETLHSATTTHPLIESRLALERSVADLRFIPTTDLPESSRRHAIAILDATLYLLRSREADLDRLNQYGAMTDHALLNRLHHRQQAILHETRQAADRPLPHRLMRYRHLASRQIAQTGMAKALQTALGNRPDAGMWEQPLAGIISALQTASEALDNADRESPASVSAAAGRVHDLWLAWGGDRDSIKPEDTQPDAETVDGDDTERTPPLGLAGLPGGMPLDRPPDDVDIPEDPLDADLESDQIGVLLERIRRREAEYHQRRRRAIAPVTEEMDW